MKHRLFNWKIALGPALLSAAVPAFGAANYTKPNFTFSGGRKPSILIAYPDVRVHRQGKEGQEIPDPEWIALAQRNVRESLSRSRLSALADLRFMTAEEATGPGPYTELLTEYHRRTGEIIFRVPQGSPDITKAKKCKCTYDFTQLKDRVATAFGPADFVLFINQYDTYATTGQILGEIAGATALGAMTPQGTSPPMRPMRIHAGNAILFDLRTGEVIWMHGDGAFGGDLRNPQSAVVRIEQALSGFPGLARK